MVFTYCVIYLACLYSLRFLRWVSESPHWLEFLDFRLWIVDSTKHIVIVLIIATILRLLGMHHGL
jgi:hypothetical protein